MEACDWELSSARVSGESTFKSLEHVIVRIWSCVRVFGGIRLRVLKCTRVWTEYGWDPVTIKERIWNCMSGFVGTQLRISKCKSENLELCKTFWGHNIECFWVHESLLLKCTRVWFGYDWELVSVGERIWSCVRRFGGITLNDFECTRVCFSSALEYGLGTIEIPKSVEARTWSTVV